jgi:hypothetical protein
MGIDAETPPPERRFFIGRVIGGAIQPPFRKPSGLRVRATLAM